MRDDDEAEPKELRESEEEEKEEEEGEKPAVTVDRKKIRFRNYRPRDRVLEACMLERPAVPNIA
jgi:hypothetical protein